MLLRTLAALALLVAPALADAQTTTRFGTVGNGSGTITTAGVSQQVFPRNEARMWLFCQNPTDATERLFIGLGNSASTTGGSIELAPGGTMGFTLLVPITTINVTAATAGHRFICLAGGQ